MHCITLIIIGRHILHMENALTMNTIQIPNMHPVVEVAIHDIICSCTLCIVIIRIIESMHCMPLYAYIYYVYRFQPLPHTIIGQLLIYLNPGPGEL